RFRRSRCDCPRGPRRTSSRNRARRPGRSRAAEAAEPEPWRWPLRSPSPFPSPSPSPSSSLLLPPGAWPRRRRTRTSRRRGARASSCARELDSDERAAAFAIFGVGATAVGFGDSLHEGEAETDRARRVAVFSPIKRLKNLSLLAGREAGAVVFDLEGDARAALEDAHARSASRVTFGVLEQVADGARDERRVAEERRALGLIVERGARGTDALERLLGDVVRDELGATKRAEIDAARREELAHERVDADDLFVELVELTGAPLLVRFAARELDEQAHPRERRSNFVRHRREARALIRELLLEPLGHVVQRVRQNRELAHPHAAIDRDARVDVARADFPCDPLDLAHRRRDAPRHEARERPQDEERHEHAEGDVRRRLVNREPERVEHERTSDDRDEDG